MKNTPLKQAILKQSGEAITRWAIALIVLVLLCAVGSAMDGLTAKVLP